MNGKIRFHSLLSNCAWLGAFPESTTWLLLVELRRLPSHDYNKKKEHTTKVRENLPTQPTSYCPAVKETYQQDRVIWDVLENALRNCCDYFVVFPFRFLRSASSCVFSFGANRLNYWWWKLHGWGDGIPWLSVSFADGFRRKGCMLAHKTLRDRRPLEPEMTTS